MFTTTQLCAVCNPWVQNAERYASQSVCINSNNDFGTPSRTYDCYGQPAGACQEKVKNRKIYHYFGQFRPVSADFGRNLRRIGRFLLISAGIGGESAGIGANRPYRRVRGASPRRRESGAGAAPILGTN